MLCASQLALSAQVLSVPPRLEPTAAPLNKLQQCGESIKKTLPEVSAKLLAGQEQLAHGLLIGWNNPTNDWASVPPPADYVVQLSQEADLCAKAAEVLKSDPSRKEIAEKVLASVANDVALKLRDCREWGMGRLINVVAHTEKNGQPDPGWTVMYKWISVSGLSAAELSFPKESTPTTKLVPPGVYAIYATKQVGDKLLKSEVKTITAFQTDKVQCEIPVP